MNVCVAAVVGYAACTSVAAAVHAVAVFSPCQSNV